MASFDPGMYSVADMDDAATTAFDNQALVDLAKKRAKNYMAMSALKDKTDENLFKAREDLEDSVMDASDAVNRSNAFTGLGTALVTGLSGIDFGGGGSEPFKINEVVRGTLPENPLDSFRKIGIEGPIYDFQA